MIRCLASLITFKNGLHRDDLSCHASNRKVSSATMAERTTNPDFMNGVPELIVLDLLGRQPMYGYELVQAIKRESGGTLAFGEGCIYPLLHKLEARGDLASRRSHVGGRSRVVYRITPKGTKQLADRRSVVEGRGLDRTSLARRQAWTYETCVPLEELVPQISSRRGLPADYAQRAAAELADHHGDLTSELIAAGFEETAASEKPRVDWATRRILTAENGP